MMTELQIELEIEFAKKFSKSILLLKNLIFIVSSRRTTYTAT